MKRVKQPGDKLQVLKDNSQNAIQSNFSLTSGQNAETRSTKQLDYSDKGKLADKVMELKKKLQVNNSTIDTLRHRQSVQDLPNPFTDKRIYKTVEKMRKDNITLAKIQYTVASLPIPESDRLTYKPLLPPKKSQAVRNQKVYNTPMAPLPRDMSSTSNSNIFHPKHEQDSIEKELHLKYEQVLIEKKLEEIILEEPHEGLSSTRYKADEMQGRKAHGRRHALTGKTGNASHHQDTDTVYSPAWDDFRRGAVRKKQTKEVKLNKPENLTASIGSQANFFSHRKAAVYGDDILLGGDQPAAGSFSFT